MGASTRILAAAAGVGLLAAPLVLGEAAVFRLGLVLVFAVAVLGLHVLVNWAGQVSLAHAGMVGLPALSVAKIAADHDLSPVVLLPLGIVLGAALGGLVSLPTLRVRGLYVTIITLAAGLAIDRFFFTRPWLVGGGNVQVPTPRIGTLVLQSSRALYPLLFALFLLALAALHAFHRSKTARALWWLKADPQAAAVGGVDRARYLIAAYVIGGGFAGFAGGLSSLWVGRLAPGSFPVTLSFTYLIAAVLAGDGGVGGVLVAAALLEGGRHFGSAADAVVAYGGPLLLIGVLVAFPEGLNGLLRRISGRSAGE